ncbi:unnamed protein product [Musa banksii]
MEGMAGNEGIGGIVSLGIAAGIGGNVTCGTIGIGGAASVGIVGTTGIGGTVSVGMAGADGRVGTVGAAGASAASSKCLAASHVMRLASVRTATRMLIVQRPALEAMRVVVEKTGAATESYDDFLASLPENDCRYAIYDFDFVTEENCQKSKIFFVAWSPSISRIGAKMLYATSKDRFRRELDGVHFEIQATDPSEMDLEILRDRAH